MVGELIRVIQKFVFLSKVSRVSVLIKKFFGSEYFSIPVEF